LPQYVTDTTTWLGRVTNSSKPNAPVTMRDVARAAGVSRMTVSRALKKDSPISRDTREKILRVVREMNYVPDQMEQIGQQILLGHTDYSPAREEEIVEAMLRRRPEAIVLSFDGHSDRTIQLLSDANVPVIELWERPENPINHTIGFSNKQAAADMTRALIAKGYRNIAFLGEGEDDWTRGAARRDGFRFAGQISRCGLRFLRLGRACFWSVVGVARCWKICA